MSENNIAENGKMKVFSIFARAKALGDMFCSIEDIPEETRHEVFDELLEIDDDEEFLEKVDELVLWQGYDDLNGDADQLKEQLETLRDSNMDLLIAFDREWSKVEDLDVTRLKAELVSFTLERQIRQMAEKTNDELRAKIAELEEQLAGKTREAEYNFNLYQDLGQQVVNDFSEKQMSQTNPRERLSNYLDSALSVMQLLGIPGHEAAHHMNSLRASIAAGTLTTYERKDDA